MSKINDILKQKVTDKKAIEGLSKYGIKDCTNETILVQTLINAAKNGDTRAAMFLLERAKEETEKGKELSAVELARESLINKKKDCKGN